MNGIARLRSVLPDRFPADRVIEATNGCWLWTGKRNAEGYANFGGGRRPDGSRLRVPAHRFAYERLIGPIPDGLHLDHQCHNEAAARGDCPGGPNCLHRACVNPAHLAPATPRDNTLRGLGPTALNATKTHCAQGHRYTLDNTRIRPGGARACRACNRARNKIRRGLQHPGERAKLSVADVRAIRSRHDRGETKATLAAEFNVHVATVSRVVRRISWQEVA